MAQLKRTSPEFHEEMYRVLAEFGNDLDYWIGPEGDMLYVSPSAERITGHAPEEFV